MGFFLRWFIFRDSTLRGGKWWNGILKLSLENPCSRVGEKLLSKTFQICFWICCSPLILSHWLTNSFLWAAIFRGPPSELSHRRHQRSITSIIQHLSEPPEMVVGYVFLSTTTPKGNCQPSLFWSPLSKQVMFFANPTILGTEIYNNNKPCCKGINFYKREKTPPFPWCFCWPWDPPTQGLGGVRKPTLRGQDVPGRRGNDQVNESMGEISPIYKPFIRIGNS